MTGLPALEVEVLDEVAVPVDRVAMRRTLVEHVLRHEDEAPQRLGARVLVAELALGERHVPVGERAAGVVQAAGVDRREERVGRPAVAAELIGDERPFKQGAGAELRFFDHGRRLGLCERRRRG
jgi:hypothetical protein